MSRSRIGLAIVLLVSLALSKGHAEDPAPAAVRGLALLAAGEGVGHLEPCDCVEGMLGGLPRRLAAIGRERGAGPTLALDLGDQTGKEVHPGLLEAKTRAALELLARGQAVVAVGEKDLRLGHRALLRTAEKAEVTLLAANLWRPAAGDQPRVRPFAASRRLEAAGKPVVVVAVLDPDLGDPTAELEATDPAAAAKEAVEAALKEPGAAGALRVLLFHGTAARAKELLGDAPPFDVVVAGHEALASAAPARLGKAWLLQTVRDARHLQRLEVVPGEAAWAVDAARASVVPLDGRIPDDAWARDRVDRYYAEVRGLPEPPRRAVAEGGRFVGSEACAACHKPQAAIFDQTKHHGAQARVAKKDPKRAALAECTACHVVGHGFEGGFVDLEATPHLGEVGCESCHGVGGNHADKGGGRGYGVRPGFPESWRPTCVGCHDATNSPKFDFAAGMERIRHWTERGRPR